MFNKETFAKVLKKINETYENQTYFGKASGVNRTYLSQYMNLKLDSPPSPKVLKGLADASKGIVSYEELMEICGYIDIDNNTISNEEKLELVYNLQTDLNILKDNTKQLKQNLFTQYVVKDSSMAPLLDKEDIAHIFKKDDYKTGETILFSIDNIEYIRKIIDYGDYVEFHAMNPYYPIIKYTKAELKEKKFTVIGKVIKAENKSAFK